MTGLVLRNPPEIPCLVTKPLKPEVLAEGREDTKIPKACRPLKLHLLDLRVALRIVAVRAAKMIRVSNLA